MKRDLADLQQRQFDVVVVGGGIHGACIARDAALRGLDVALVEQADFCSATSHNSLKTIHGGIRYLQHLNLKRTIESIREQQILLQTLPHLVKPIRFLMPTYGFGMRGPVAMGIGVGMFEMLNALVSVIDGRRLNAPKGRMMRAQTCERMAPGVNNESLTGGGMWADAQVTFADTAVLQILQQAADSRANVANDVRAERLLFDQDNPERVIGLHATDRRTGEPLEIKARCVVNATGPWAANWIGESGQSKLSLEVGLVKSMNLVTDREALPHALAVKSKRASDSKVDSAKRMFFVVPWQGKAVIGTTHFTHRDAGSEVAVNRDEMSAFVDEFNDAYPEMALSMDNILYCYQGLTPGDDEAGQDGAKLHESKIVDHSDTDGIRGMFSIVSIKWTTARLVAEKAVDQVLKQWNEPRSCATRKTVVPDYDTIPHRVSGLTDDEVRDFVTTHIENTQAYRLSDVVLRRTNDLALGAMGAKQFVTILRTMSQYFDWSPERRARETEQVLAQVPSLKYRNILIDELEAFEL